MYIHYAWAVYIHKPGEYVTDKIVLCNGNPLCGVVGFLDGRSFVWRNELEERRTQCKRVNYVVPEAVTEEVFEAQLLSFGKTRVSALAGGDAALGGEE